jgi:hypothetical protein
LVNQVKPPPRKSNDSDYQRHHKHRDREIEDEPMEKIHRHKTQKSESDDDFLRKPLNKSKTALNVNKQ